MVMMNSNEMTLSSLSAAQLESLLELYPWFHCARRELYLKMSEMGEEYARIAAKKAALYVYSPKILLEAEKVLAAGHNGNWRKETAESEDFLFSASVPRTVEVRRKPARVAGGDYFSKEELESVSEGAFPDGLADAINEERHLPELPEDYFYTETLAKIYSRQELHQLAIDVYEKLFLKFPEKSAYFAALIEEQKKYL